MVVKDMGPSLRWGDAVRGMAVAFLLAGSVQAVPAPQRDAAGFPAPSRPVAKIVSAAWSNEPDREQADEAASVIAAAGVAPGMTVGDVGAGEGYYTLHLARAVGPGGKILAEDIVPGTVTALRARLRIEGVENAEVIEGMPDDAKLPAARFDRIFLVHMYHEIAQPYGLLWRLRPALKAGGRIVIVDADRQTARHGTPPKLLTCELSAAGYRMVSRRDMPEAGGYLAMFEPAGPAPQPSAIQPCKG